MNKRNTKIHNRNENCLKWRERKKKIKYDEMCRDRKKKKNKNRENFVSTLYTGHVALLKGNFQYFYLSALTEFTSRLSTSKAIKSK